jgi:hypothetical protein
VLRAMPSALMMSNGLLVRVQSLLIYSKADTLLLCSASDHRTAYWAVVLVP